MTTDRLVGVLRGCNLLEHTTWLGACGCSRDYADEKNCTQDPSRSRWKIFERRAACWSREALGLVAARKTQLSAYFTATNAL